MNEDSSSKRRIRGRLLMLRASVTATAQGADAFAFQASGKPSQEQSQPPFESCELAGEGYHQNHKQLSLFEDWEQEQQKRREVRGVVPGLLAASEGFMASDISEKGLVGY
ncbi:hypothetical protein DFH09DRAFT_1325446 [Mycena vulgaris]|nr:hypothetical protein DFH09DRAFT_1325446 [Mycena vulgaris]